MTGQVALKHSIPVANELGECILWDDRHGQVLWTDMPGRMLHIHDPDAESTSTIEIDEDLCSFALIEDSDNLLCAFQSGFAVLDRHTGECAWLHRIDNADKLRLNDGRVDRQGRFWCGSLIDNQGKGPEGGLSGGLFCVDHDGSISNHLDGIGVSNSLCWSPDGGTMYFGDTLVKEIWAFDYDQNAGAITNRRIFARTPETCGPDGSTVDADGCIWNAEWGEGRVVRYRPDGPVDTVVQLPVSHVTCITFGGENLSDLYVTTATYGLSQEQKSAEPEAGNVFVYATPYQGLVENRFVNRISNAGIQQ